MSAGTLTLTNGSAIVGGSGTSFTTELAVGDFIVSTVGGVPYTLPVKTVDSDTQLILVSNFTGPTQSGAAWSAVPRVALNMVTAALVAQSAEALRGLNYDKQNWQSIFSGTGNVTVTLPDGTTWTGPAWNSITTSLSGKAAKGANRDITSLSGLTTALSVEQGGTGSTTVSGARTNLGLGNSSTRDVGTAAGTVAAGNDSRLNSVDQKAGGKITSPITVQPGVGGNPGFAISSGDNGGGGLMNNGISLIVANGYNPNTGNYVNILRGTWYTGEWTFGGARGGGANFDNVTLGLKGSDQEGLVAWVFHSNGAATGNWVTASDKRIKENVTVIAEPLMKMQQLRGVEWDRLDTPAHGYGFIAQEVEKVFPEAVKSYGKTTLRDGSEIEDVKSVDTFGVAAALHHEAILALMDEVSCIKRLIKELHVGALD
ncbi:MULTISPECIES: tail fiber domain-containing protein [Enterobacter]|uniref:Tail fiber domain-containing protein n=1 Tax=Enterobacter dykesii TaxID=2797506 RepID=A0AAU7J5T7_9ENTR|nr:MULTISPECIES: tail fiber domain-containing protein [Enterobacter]KAA0528716.1 tail fiber domain-containing protein [Enterobacter asburiae]KAA0533184.1 tail fiber domain-containing protein [Enterobacter dykesii]